ncbi:MAG: hypothetical protein EBU08_03745 [Micrococcales bacterium]|nr:hypothetical protein [Micrococcales bacterium]
MPKKTDEYTVYEIWISGRRRYVGFTKDLIQRQKQHNRLCFKTDYKKDLYNNIRKWHPELKEVMLIESRKFKDKVEAKRWECLLILDDHFSVKDLWQKVPRISDI